MLSLFTSRTTPPGGFPHVADDVGAGLGGDNLGRDSLIGWWTEKSEAGKAFILPRQGSCRGGPGAGHDLDIDNAVAVGAVFVAFDTLPVSGGGVAIAIGCWLQRVRSDNMPPHAVTDGIP